jgi:hypothetical protein
MFKNLRVRLGSWPRGKGLKGAPFGFARKFWTRLEKLAIDKNTSSLATPSANRNEKKVLYLLTSACLARDTKSVLLVSWCQRYEPFFFVTGTLAK